MLAADVILAGRMPARRPLQP